MEVKATHKLVILASGDMWDLADTGHGLYYKMTNPRQSDRWVETISALRDYINHEDFSCKQTNKFKGNK